MGELSEGRSDGLETWLAFVAGEQVYADPDETPSSSARAAALVKLAALATVILAVWLMAAARTPPPEGLAAWAPAATTAAALALAIRPIRLLRGRRREASPWRSVAWRSAAGLIVITGLLANAPQWGAFVVAPFGIFAGAEAALCAWAVGLEISPLRWFVRCLLSPIHVGVLLGLAAIGAWTSLEDLAERALPIYLTLWLTLGVGCVTAWLLNSIYEQQSDDERETSSRITSTEHRRMAHWLHDDVAAALRTVSLRLQTETLAPHEVIGLLDALDHQLRLRQLDQLLESGSVRLAEILQPYVRDAQRNGINITAVPTFDDASLVVGEETGRLFARAASILTSNAIQAGATELGYVVHHDDRTITLGVSDDAGGFDINAVPAGRALWQLHQDLGARGISTTANGPGTTVTITIPIDRSQPHVQPAAR